MSKTFEVWVEGPSFTLTEEEIWPDGDAPENPTDADVIDAMMDYGSASSVIRDWALDDGLTIHVGTESYD